MKSKNNPRSSSKQYLRYAKIKREKLEIELKLFEKDLQYYRSHKN